MLCEQCGKNNATAFFTQTINGKTTQKRLCTQCATYAGGDIGGFGGIFSNFPFSSFFKTMSSQAENGDKRCPRCGISIDEIMERGKIGCADCYKAFSIELLPTIQGIHGRATHVGKRPHSAVKSLFVGSETNRQRLDELNKMLAQAIDEQNFEMAAKHRDEIRAIEESGKHGGNI